MPIYVYQVIQPDGGEGDTFEVEQSMSDDALTHHPRTGEPVRRVYQPPNLATQYTPGATKSKLENKNVEKAGFTKYERDKLTGQYHRTAGKDRKAPDVIDPKNL
ncbi:MAG: FmdB family transcriptional regulator [Verrucomicrobiota bacterium]